MKYYPLLLILISVVSCNSPTDHTSNSMEKKKIDELKNILNTQEKWVKVHAAEFLIWEDLEIDLVKKSFLYEEKLFDTVAQYRIGIWRVLNQASKSTAEREIYLKKITAAFQAGPDSLHALETLAKLKQPISLEEPQFANQILQAQEITSFEIYGLWNLYHDPKIDKAKITDRLIALLNDPKQSDLNKTIVSYVFRYLEISKNVQKKLIQIDLDALSKPVQLQLLASILINFGLDEQQYDVYKQKLLALKQVPNYVTAVILALSAKDMPENGAEIEQLATILSDTTASIYNPDNHATANYAWLQFHRLAQK